MSKNVDLKFEEFPFIVPSEKEIKNKSEKVLNELKNAQNADEFKKAIKKWFKLNSYFETQLTNIYVLYDMHTDNPKYKEAQDKMDELTPLLSSYSNQYAKIITSSPFRKEMEEKWLGSYYFKMYENVLRSFDDRIIPELIEQNKLTSEYTLIMSSAQIEFDGKTLNLPQLGKYMKDKDRNVRKAAAIALDKWLGEHEEKIGTIYDKLVHLRDTMAKKLGFKDFAELGYLNLGRVDYNAEMVAGYRQQIYEEVVPICAKLYKDQIKRIGVKKPQFYDYSLMFLDGNPTPAGDEAYLTNEAKKMYSALGEESKEYFNFMVDHHLLDLSARPGKAPGGFMTFFPDYKCPIIFSNFNGTDGDVNVLTHEGGHAFQGYLCRDMKIPEYRSPTLESCEIHSMSMEFFAWPYMDGFFGKDAKKYRYSHLCDAIEFLPYGITIDEFQHWVYANPNATHAERCAKFKEIETKYTPEKKYDDCPTLNKGTYWLRQSHVFGSPFYYIDYTLAQVCAFQFLEESRKDHPKAWNKYVKFSKCGGKYPFVELITKNHIRNPFINGNVKKNVRPLIKILKEVEADLNGSNK